MFGKSGVSLGSTVVNTLTGGYGNAVDSTVNKGRAKGEINKVQDAIGAQSPFHRPDLLDAPPIKDPKRINMGDYMMPGNTGINPVAEGANSPQYAFRNYQMGLAQQLQDQVAGKGPSLAAEQAKATMNQGIAQQFAMANSARGGNNAAMQRGAMMAGSDMAAKTGQMAAQARLAEQMQAAQQLGQVSGQGRQQDLSIAFKNADMNVQKAQLAAQYTAMGLDARKANLMADLQVQQMIQGQVAAKNGSIVAADSANKQMWGGLISGGAKMATAGSTGSPGGAPQSDASLDDTEGYEDEFTDNAPPAYSESPYGGGYTTGNGYSYANGYGSAPNYTYVQR